MEMYSSGDPYLMMAKRAGSIPPEGTKSTHGEEEECLRLYPWESFMGWQPSPYFTDRMLNA